MPSWGNGDNPPNGQQYEENMESPEGRTLTVNGQTTCNGLLLVNNVTTANEVRVAGGVTIVREGNLQIKSTDGTALAIANNEEAGHLYLGKPDGQANVIVESPRLIVGPNGIDGKIDANGNAKLRLGSDVQTNHVEIGRSQHFATVKGRLDAEEHIQVGTGGDGKVDASANNRELKIGTNTTGNVTIGRIAQGLWTKVVNLFKAEGHIQVGTGGDGKVDASANNLDLKLGTDTTRDVIICRDGQSVVVLGGTVWLNLDRTAAVKVFTQGRGFGPCLDLVISGATHFYVDTEGGHDL